MSNNPTLSQMTEEELVNKIGTDAACSVQIFPDRALACLTGNGYQIQYALDNPDTLQSLKKSAKSIGLIVPDDWNIDAGMPEGAIEMPGMMGVEWDIFKEGFPTNELKARMESLFGKRDKLTMRGESNKTIEVSNCKNISVDTTNCSNMTENVVDCKNVIINVTNCDKVEIHLSGSKNIELYDDGYIVEQLHSSD